MGFRNSSGLKTSRPIQLKNIIEKYVLEFENSASLRTEIGSLFLARKAAKKNFIDRIADLLKRYLKFTMDNVKNENDVEIITLKLISTISAFKLESEPLYKDTRLIPSEKKGQLTVLLNNLLAELLTLRVANKEENFEKSTFTHGNWQDEIIFKYEQEDILPDLVELEKNEKYTGNMKNGVCRALVFLFAKFTSHATLSKFSFEDFQDFISDEDDLYAFAHAFMNLQKKYVSSNQFIYDKKLIEESNTRIKSFCGKLSREDISEFEKNTLHESLRKEKNKVYIEGNILIILNENKLKTLLSSYSLPSFKRSLEIHLEIARKALEGNFKYNYIGTFVFNFINHLEDGQYSEFEELYDIQIKNVNFTEKTRLFFEIIIRGINGAHAVGATVVQNIEKRLETYYFDPNRGLYKFPAVKQDLLQKFIISQLNSYNCSIDMGPLDVSFCNVFKLD